MEKDGQLRKEREGMRQRGRAQEGEESQRGRLRECISWL